MVIPNSAATEDQGHGFPRLNSNEVEVGGKILNYGKAHKEGVLA